MHAWRWGSCRQADFCYLRISQSTDSLVSTPTLYSLTVIYLWGRASIRNLL